MGQMSGAVVSYWQLWADTCLTTSLQGSIIEREKQRETDTVHQKCPLKRREKLALEERQSCMTPLESVIISKHMFGRHLTAMSV